MSDENIDCWAGFYTKTGYRQNRQLINGPTSGAVTPKHTDDIDSFITGPRAWVQVWKDNDGGPSGTTGQFGPNTCVANLDPFGLKNNISAIQIWDSEPQGWSESSASGCRLSNRVASVQRSENWAGAVLDVAEGVLGAVPVVGDVMATLLSVFGDLAEGASGNTWDEATRWINLQIRDFATAVALDVDQINIAKLMDAVGAVKAASSQQALVEAYSVLYEEVVNDLKALDITATNPQLPQAPEQTLNYLVIIGTIAVAVMRTNIQHRILYAAFGNADFEGDFKTCVAQLRTAVDQALSNLYAARTPFVKSSSYQDGGDTGERMEDQRTSGVFGVKRSYWELGYENTTYAAEVVQNDINRYLATVLKPNFETTWAPVREIADYWYYATLDSTDKPAKKSVRVLSGLFGGQWSGQDDRAIQTSFLPDGASCCGFLAYNAGGLNGGPDLCGLNLAYLDGGKVKYVGVGRQVGTGPNPVGSPELPDTDAGLSQVDRILITFGIRPFALQAYHATNDSNGFKLWAIGGDDEGGSGFVSEPPLGSNAELIGVVAQLDGSKVAVGYANTQNSNIATIGFYWRYDRVVPAPAVGS